MHKSVTKPLAQCLPCKLLIKYDIFVSSHKVSLAQAIMTERYKFTLSAELLEKANKELNEPKSDSQRLKAIDLFLETFEEKYPLIGLPRNDDAFVLRFLRARKFNQKKAISLLHKYLTQPADWPAMFDKIWNPVLMGDALDSGAVVPLASKAKNGSTVIVVRPGLGEKNIFLDLFADLFLTIETLLDDESVQINGVTVIQDMAYLSMDMVKQMSPLVAKKFINTLQECTPVRICSMNTTNQSRIFDVFFSIVQPFMNNKTKSRFNLHGTNFSDLYGIVDRSVLPPMFVGEGPELNPEDWKSKLIGESTEL